MFKTRIFEHPDAQCREPEGYCIRCQGELWGVEAEPDWFGHVMCPECLEELDVPHEN